MRINWKQKFTSRKFWAAVVAFVTSILVTFGVNELTTQQCVAIISATGTMVAYIIGEGLVDASRVKKENDENDELF